MTILFVSDPSDAHLPPVLTELGRRGHEIQIFDPAAFPNAATVTVDSGACGQRAFIRWAEQAIDLAAIRSVWYRRPGGFCPSPKLAPGAADWLREECAALIGALYANTDALWVSEPHAIRHASLKLLQLRVAQKLGFRIPAYTVTNDPKRARAFLAEHPGGLVVKTLAQPMIRAGDRAMVMYTHLLSRGDTELLDSVRHGPTFLQAFVPKARDVRVTVIGDEIFAAGIDSTAVAEARIDFRRAEIMDLRHEPVTLPGPVAAASLALVRDLGLRFGAIDLLETPAGEYVFLEINPNGQWYWVEMMTGQPMARAMADLLERGEPGRGVTSTAARAGQSPPGPRVVSISEHTIPTMAWAAQPADGEARARLTGATATRAWFEQKGGDLLLRMGDVERG